MTASVTRTSTSGRDSGFREISVLFAAAGAGIDRRALKQFAAQLSADIAKGRPFTYLVTRDRVLQRLNRDFLEHDYPTDVLSFPSGAKSGFAGEIAISLDRAREQSAAAGHSVEEEIRVLMVHGLLHLLGMDHESDRGRMARAETHWRKHYGLPSGLIERTRS